MMKNYVIVVLSNIWFNGPFYFAACYREDCRKRAKIRRLFVEKIQIVRVFLGKDSL